MRICVGGKNEIAISVCEYLAGRFPVSQLYVVPARCDGGEDTFQRSLKKYALGRGITVTTLDEVCKWEDLVFFSVEFDRILDVRKFRSDRLFNIHLSLLPKYKGVYTSALPILNGDSETGVTFHRIERGIDTGDIIAQRTLKIEDEETCESLMSKLYRAGAALVIENIDRVILGKYSARRQPLRGSSYYSKSAIDYAHLEVDLNQTADYIDRQIRAYHFRAYQLPVVFGHPIMHAAFTTDKSSLPPGRIISESETMLRISTVDYDLLLYKDRLSELTCMAARGDVRGLMEVPDIEYYAHEKDNVHGMTLLMAAARSGQKEAVNFLLEKGFDPEEKDYAGISANHYE
ncbi:MAG: hypothetical protein J5835_04370 [Bacteroidales bacterium]|nr:hypothetical protein [Bacteroidales bacterium]